MKRMSKRSLNEGYGIAKTNTNSGGNAQYILFVFGKQVSENVALIYDPESDSYSYTVIGTGMSLGKHYKRINDAVRDEFTVRQFEEDLRNKEEIQRKLTDIKMFYEKLLKQKKFK